MSWVTGRVVPEEWGMSKEAKHTDFMFLNLGPNHPSVHGVFRIALQLDGEVIVDAVPDIGYHHRASEKMAKVSPTEMPTSPAWERKKGKAPRTVAVVSRRSRPSAARTSSGGLCPQLT